MPQQDDSPAENRQRILHLQTICLLILAASALIFMLIELRPVLVPFVVAVFVVSGVSPILAKLQRRLHVSRMVAAGIAFATGALLTLGFGFSMWLSVAELGRNASAYQQRVEDLTHRLEQYIPWSLIDSLSDSPSIENSVTNAPAAGEAEPAGSPPETTNPATRTVTMGPAVKAMISSGITQVSTALGSLISSGPVVLIFVFFLLLGSPSQQNTSQTVRELDQQVRSYLGLKTVISLFTGLAFGLALKLFGVPMPLTFGLLAVLLNFIPNIGPVIASVLPIPLILIDPQGSSLWMACAIFVIFAIQLASGNLVEPRLMGESANLHPVTILMALMFWGMIWGIIGMFLATPITAVIRIGLHRSPFTKPVALLMSGTLPED